MASYKYDYNNHFGIHLSHSRSRNLRSPRAWKEPLAAEPVQQSLHLKYAENHQQTIGKPWENHGKMVIITFFMGKPQENHRKMMVLEFCMGFMGVTWSYTLVMTVTLLFKITI